MPFDIEAVSAQAQNRMILWLDETDSTMLDASRLAEAGCPSGTTIGADRQTAGQGRHGHSWVSEKESGLYCSIVLRPSLPAEHLPAVTMAVGLAVAEAITHQSGIAVDLRWPNDVLIGNRKVCGILIQQQDRTLLCGIGINVNHLSFPEEIAPIATSLRIATGRELPREPLLLELLPAIDRHIQILAGQGPDAILKLFTQASSFVSGRRVTVDQGGRLLRGVTAGLDPSGFLILQHDDGARTLILAGGVRPE